MTDSAIILSREIWREADKRAWFFTLHQGKVDAIAIGAHKIRSKLAGHLEPVRAVDVMLAEGKRGFKIAQCVTRHNFFDQGITFERGKYLGTIVRLIKNATEFNHPDSGLYELLFNALAQIQNASEDQLKIVFGQQLLILATHFGYAPEFDVCVVCRCSEDLTRFSSPLGGIICKNERVQEKILSFDRSEHRLHEFVAEVLRWRGLI